MSDSGTKAAGPRFRTDQERWRAVTRRDPRADGRFVYSVQTTGVYCRPSCGARLARRANVRFHPSAAAAERAGFRACKRCRPNGRSVPRERAELITRACRLIEQADAKLDLQSLAAATGLGPSRFHRLFKAVVGLTPKGYADGVRARRMRAELGKERSITMAIYASGYSSSGRFHAESDRILGMKPTAFRQKGEGETIRFAVGHCSLGGILVASTEIGVCRIAIGDDPDVLVSELEEEFANADLVDGDEEFEKLVAQVIAYVETPAVGWDLPLDLRGTAFQLRVWRALAEIPRGTTTTYRELAGRVDRPAATRAVAHACAANRIAVAIPCHRVVRSDGTLAGYRWGVERKAALIEREREGAMGFECTSKEPESAS